MNDSDQIDALIQEQAARDEAGILGNSEFFEIAATTAERLLFLARHYDRHAPDNKYIAYMGHVIDDVQRLSKAIMALDKE